MDVAAVLIRPDFPVAFLLLVVAATVAAALVFFSIFVLGEREGR
jgi:hypothetical protein